MKGIRQNLYQGLGLILSLGCLQSVFTSAALAHDAAPVAITFAVAGTLAAGEAEFF